MGLLKALGNDLVKPYTNPYTASGIKKLRPQVTTGILGAGLGAYATGMTDGGMGAAGGFVAGGIAGALAMPAMGLLGAGIGSLGMKAVQNPQAIGNGLANIGTGMMKAGKGTAIAGGVAGAGAAKVGYYGYRKASNFAGGLIKYTPGKTEVKNGEIKKIGGKFRPTAVGYTVAAGIAGMMGVNNLADKGYESRAGVPSGTRTATPNYLDNAGATGDLVFAMHQNRRG